jgi:hypothetical protein
MSTYTPPPTIKKPADLDASLYDFVNEHSVDDGIPQVDDEEMTQECLCDGEQITTTCQTNTDLAGQTETRQSTSGFMLCLDNRRSTRQWLHGEDRQVVDSCSRTRGNMARGNGACKFVEGILTFYGNDHRRNYCLCTDNQATEHLCTQSNMSEASRGTDVRHRVMKQDCQGGNMRVGGVKSTFNDSGILPKNLPPPTHKWFCVHLRIFDDNNDTDDGDEKQFPRMRVHHTKKCSVFPLKL